MSISMFLKNRRKKRLLEQIYKLKEEAALFEQAAKVARQSADEVSKYICLRQTQAAAGDWSSSIHLSCYLDNYLRQIKLHENNYAISKQKYLNTQDKLKRLEKELETL